MHRASPTLLLTATCLAGSLLTASAAAADDGAPTPTPTPTPLLLSNPPSSPTDITETAEPTPTATPSPTFPLDAVPEIGTSPTPIPGREGDQLLSVNVAMPGQVDVAIPGESTVTPAVAPPRSRLPLVKGHYGLMVATLQSRLAWLGYPTPVSAQGAFGTKTRAAVKAFQSKNWLKPTGKVDRRTWRLLRKHSTPVGALPKSCTSVRMSLCIDKTARVLRLVEKGRVTMTADARFGQPGMDTDEGVFSIHEKSYNHTSSKYGSYMPRAMFFNGDEAVHYSPDFAAYGYLHGSHGCVGLRDMAIATSLFTKVPVGTRVVVYWS